MHKTKKCWSRQLSHQKFNFFFRFKFFCCSHFHWKKMEQFSLFFFWFEWERSRMNEPTKNTKAAHTKLLRLRFSPVITWYPPPMIVIKDIIFLCPPPKERENFVEKHRNGSAVAAVALVSRVDKFQNWRANFWIYWRQIIWKLGLIFNNFFKINK